MRDLIKLTLLCCIYSLVIPETQTQMISRAQWGARPARSTTWLNWFLPYVIIHHTATPTCDSLQSCSARVRSIQNYHMDSNGWSDIGYNFLIGGDGRIYEGRGLWYQGAHAYGYNSRSIGIAFIGNFGSSAPSYTARYRAKQIIIFAKAYGKLSSSVRINGHRDVGSTACPGTALYNLLYTIRP